MNTEMDGNPPIYVTKRRSHHNEEFYVNNAMIIKSRSNVEMKNGRGNRQVSSARFSFFSQMLLDDPHKPKK